jgi:hypothetical protein
MNIPPWSYSSLTKYETCPRQYHVVKVLKLVREPPTIHTDWGIEVHKAFEDGIDENKPLPDSMAQWQPVLLKFQNTPGEKFTEMEIALDRNFKPVEWASPEAWARGIGDVVVEQGSTAISGDWKTGKRKPESTQLMMFAALLMHARPHIERVKTAFVWLKEKKIDKALYTKDDLPSIWKEFIPRVAKLESSYEKDKWVPRPSGLCKNYCAVTSCEFNGKRK